MRFIVFVLMTVALSRAQPPAGSADATAEFEGTWLGEVTAPNDRTAIGFAFQRTEKGLLTSFYMPAMFLPGVTFGPAQIADGRLRFRPLDTTLVRDGDRLTGWFGLSHLPVELRRADKFPAAPAPPIYPAAPAPRWTASLDAETWASPVVRDGTIYLGTADGKFHALDAADGRRRWTFPESGRAPATLVTYPIYGSALVTDTQIYYLDSRENVRGVNRTDGRFAFLAEPPPSRELPPDRSLTHRTATPVLADGVLYCGSRDGGLYARDAITGLVAWRHEAGAAIHATPAVAGPDLIFGCLDGSVIALNRRTRQETARTKLPGPVVSTPVVAGDTVIVGCRDYMLYGLRRADLTIAWRFSFWFSWVESTPALMDGTLYIGGSDFARVTALDPATGRAHWSTVVGGLTWGTPLVTADTVFAGTHAQANAIIPHQAGIVALDRQTGAVKWRHAIPLARGAERAGIIGSLALAGDQVIGVGFDGTVIALPAK